VQSLITSGVKISVENFYQDDYSSPVESKFVFAYRITIENLNTFSIQLMRRHWFIVDSNTSIKEVEGEGVIGKQPLLHPGDVHQYISWSQLQSEVGKMYGYYLMKDMATEELFKVSIPEFKLIAPFKLN
jgi:ApaG protein